MTSRRDSLTLIVALLFTGCAAQRTNVAPGIRVAALGAERSDAFGALADEVSTRNPGYAVEWHPECRALPAIDALRLVFVQRGTSTLEFEGETRMPAEAGPGDLIVLRPLHALRAASSLDLLAFTVPSSTGPLPIDIPPVLRPDHDPAIDDQRGGCATEDKPYRRLLLTWRPENGPYVFRGLNAHRVKIENSFTHYHPQDGGFDEFYLVQSEKPGARLITSDRRESIEAEAEDPAASQWFFQHPLGANELIYIPRGVIHRGVGGAVVMVITIPGFRPGAEIGVDHHLKAISRRNPSGDALPFNEEASAGPAVR